MNMTFRELMEAQGWIFEEFRCFKKVGEHEIDIEFCIGDFCLGIYDKSLSLLEQKQRCENFLQAFINHYSLLEKYGLSNTDHSDSRPSDDGENI